MAAVGKVNKCLSLGTEDDGALRTQREVLQRQLHAKRRVKHQRVLFVDAYKLLKVNDAVVVAAPERRHGM